MADRATGPLKPPVIDLTARAAGRSEGEPRPAPESPPGLNRRDASPRTPESAGRASWPLLAGVAVAGAVLGTVLTYLVAIALPLPTHQPALPDLTPRLEAQDARLGTIEQGLGDLKASTTRTQVSLDATITTLDGDMTAVNKSIADVKAAMPAAAPAVDLSPLETQLATLKSEVDAVSAGASGTDAGAIAQHIATLETTLGSVTSRIDGLDANAASLRTDLDAARKALTDHIASALPSEVGPAMKLPLLLAGLQSAFDGGKPFTAELAGLKTIVPDLAVPAALDAAAATGLSRPDVLLQRFETALPDILAARDTTGSDWGTDALDWAKSLLALRPAEEQPGDSPEAIVSRLEGAMGRNDYAAAMSLLAQLPPKMQQAATPVAGDIAAHAAADQLVTDLRAKALAAAGTAP
ncbi:MAG TPA: hypothetical protein VHZ56_01920 [Devosia sp.]|nr:hypothetical protein [Devosia sp.]